MAAAPRDALGLGGGPVIFRLVPDAKQVARALEVGGAGSSYQLHAGLLLWEAAARLQCGMLGRLCWGQQPWAELQRRAPAVESGQRDLGQHAYQKAQHIWA